MMTPFICRPLSYLVIWGLMHLGCEAVAAQSIAPSAAEFRIYSLYGHSVGKGGLFVTDALGATEIVLSTLR